MKQFIYAFFNSLTGAFRWNQKLVLFASLLFVALGTNAQLVNVPVTGFNNDIVAGGTGTGTPGSMPGVSYPAIGINGGIPAATSLIDNTYKWSASNAAATCYMPVTNLAASARTSGLIYQLQNYSANNAMTIDNNSSTYPSPFSNSGTLTLSSPATYTTLFVLYESAVNVSPLNVDVTVTFTDASSQLFSGIALQNFNFFNSNVAFGGGISSAQNISPGDPTGCASSTAPFLFEMSLPLNAANLTKQVQSISFSIPAVFNSGTATNSVNYFHALAVGGRAACSAPMHGNYTIDNSQLTAGTNFSSFPDFAAALLCAGVDGPVIATVGGNSAFDEQVEFGTIPGASATNTITINGNGKRITKTLNSLTANLATMSFNGTSYFTVNNLQIDALGFSHGFGVHLRNNSTFNTFSNCTINTNLNATSSNANNTSTPVVISNSTTSTANPGVNGSNNTFISCTVSGGRNGFFFQGDGSNPLNNHDNNIINCIVRDWDAAGINLSGSLSNCLISGNVVERPNRNAFGTSGTNAITVSSGVSQNIQITNNKIRNLWAQNLTSTSLTTCISITVVGTAGNENKVMGNLISDIISRGSIIGISCSGTGYLTVAHNTISIEDPNANAGSTLTATGISYSLATGSNNVSVLNNIIKINRYPAVITNTNTNVQTCLQYSSPIFASNNNDLSIAPQYISAPGATNSGTTITVASTAGLAPTMQLFVTGGTGAFAAGVTVSSVTNATTFIASAAPTVALSGGAVITGSTHYVGQNTSGSATIPNQPTLAGWKAQNPALDQNSFNVDPGFVNPSLGNYQPTAAVLNNIGTPVGSLTDITGAPRSPFSPDPGAYEFTPVGTDALIQWVSPIPPVASGLTTVTVRLVNTMDATITSADLTYSLNGVDQQTFNFTGLNIPAGGSAQLSFSTQFNLAASATLVARINLINGAPDANSTNNTTGISLCPALSGAYTINGTLATGGTNFQTFNALNNALNCGGIAGPLTVTVAPGNYNEQVEFKAVTGSSSVNTITINGNNVSYAGTATAASAATTITVGNTAGLSVGMTVAVLGGSGVFSGTTTVASITDATHFVVSNTPTTPLATGDVITAHSTTLTSVPSVAATPATLTLNGSDNMKFQNLNVVSGGTLLASMACHLWNQADNNSFTGCTFTSTPNGSATSGQVPFSMSGSPTSTSANGLAGNDLSVIGCTMNGGQYSFMFYGAGGSSGQTPSNTSTGLILKNCLLLDAATTSIRVANTNACLVSGNIIERPNRSAATLTGTYTGIILEATCFNSLIEKNLIRKSFERGTNLTTGTFVGMSMGNSATAGNENLIYNNVFSDVSANTTAVTTFCGAMIGLNSSFTSFFKFYHNTIAFENTLAAGSTASSVGIASTAAQNIDVRNNIISIKRGGSAASYCLQYVVTGGIPATSTSQSDYNDLYITPGSNRAIGLANVVSAVPYPTLAAWQAATPNFDLHSRSVDPRFTGPSSGDFTPRAGGINNIGTNLSVAQDFLGASRTTTPDPGAFEFSPPARDAFISWVSPATAPIFAGSNPIVVNILNNGSSPITSIKLRYVDNAGIPVQVDEPFTGLNIAGGANQNITFTTPYILSSAVTITASIQELNGIVGDADATNDAVSQSLCVPLSGNYTINATLPVSATNFVSFTDAVNTLVTCGVSGPVVFDVFGTHNLQLEIPPIPGTSSVNTVTMNGGARYPSTIYNSAAGASSSGTTITVGNTTGLAPGMTVWVNAGVGQFASGTTVVSITNATTFVVSAAPTTALTSVGASIVSAMQSTITNAPASTNASLATLRLTGADYMIWNNTNFTSTSGTFGFAGMLSNASDFNAFNNCTFATTFLGTTATSAALTFSNNPASGETGGAKLGSSNTFTGCSFVGGYTGIILNGVANSVGLETTTANNSFINCSIRDFQIYGIRNLSFAKATTISHCVIERPTRLAANIAAGTSYGIQMRNGSENCLIDGNLIRNLYGNAATSTGSCAGITLEINYSLASAVNTISNNIISNVGSPSGRMTGIELATTGGGSYYRLLHNTVYLNYPSYNTTNQAIGIAYGGGSIGNEIQNNVVYMAFAGTGTGKKYCIQLQSGTAGLSAFNNNDYYFKQQYISAPGATSSSTTITVASTTGLATGMPLFVTSGTGVFATNTTVVSILNATQFTCSSAPTTALSNNAVVAAGYHYLGQRTGTDVPSLAAWKSAIPAFEQQSIHADPQFIDAANGNFTPNFFALDNTANPVGITTDYNSNPRSLTTPDMGAIEATMAAATDLTPVALVAPGNSGCYLSSEPIIVRIKNLGNTTQDFASANATVTCIVTGAATGTFSATLSSGTLAPKATMDVTLSPTVNMSATGSYTFNISTAVVLPAVDGDLSNNSLAPVTITSAPLATGTVAADRSELCSGRPTLTLRGSAGGFIQWEESTSAGGPWNPAGSGTAVNYSNAATAASSGTTITVGSTVGLYVGMPVTVSVGGTGAFAAGTTVASITDVTHFVVSTTPNIQLVSGDFITGSLPAYIPAADLTQSMSYRATVSCGANSATSNVVTVSYNPNPQLLSTSGASRCGTGPVTLTASVNANAYANWYNSPTSSYPVYSGNSSTGTNYSIPNLSASATYYVSASYGTSSKAAGFTVPTDFPTNLFTTSNWGVVFNALQPFRIGNVDVYASAGSNAQVGTVTFALQNSSGVTLVSKTVNVLGYVAPLSFERRNTIDLGFDVPVGTGYRLITTAMSGINGLQYATSSGPSFYASPYNYYVPEVMTLTAGWLGTNASPVWYPTFYNITVITGCETARQSVTANFNPAPAITAGASSGLVCPGTSTQLSVLTSGNPAYTFTWTPGNLTGSSVTAFPELNTVYTVSAADNTAGPFAGCVATATVNVATKPKVSVNTSATPLSVCSGGNSQLAVAASTTVNYAMSAATPGPIAASGTITTLDKNNMTGNTGGLNDGYFTVSLPFVFPYFGASYDKVYMNTNGFVSFGQGYSSFASNAMVTIPHTGDVNNSIYLAWKDWDLTNTGSIQYFTVGSAPHRTFVIKYVNVPGQTNGFPLNGQIELYEDNGKIELFLASTDNNKYVSAPGATNSGTTITVASTVGLVPGMAVAVTSGTGVIGAGITVSSILNATQFTIQVAPSTALSNNAVITATGNFNIIKTLGIESNSGVTAFAPSPRNGEIWTIATPEQWEFMPFGGTLSYNWTPAIFLDDPTLTNPFASFIFNTTTFTATVSDALDGCSGSSSVTVSTGDPLNAPAVAQTPVICNGQSSILTSTPAGGCAPYHYLWTDADNNTLGIGSFISVSPGTTSTYYLLVTDDVGSEYSSEVTVTVNPLPNVTSTQGLICGTGTATLTASGAATYVWSPTTNLNTSTGSVVISSTQLTRTYTVTGTSAAGCINTALATVTKSYPVIVSADASPSALAVGGNAQLNATASEVRPATTYYTRDSISGLTFTPLTGPGITKINSVGQLVPTFGSGTSDDGGVLINLPFTFTYFGNTFTKMSMCTNGWVAAGDYSTIDAGSSRSNNFFFSNSAPNNTIAAWYRDLAANFSGGGSMRHGLIGTDIYAFQWDSVTANNSTEPSADMISYQVTIYGPNSGTPGRIEILYGPIVGNMTIFQGAIGVEDAIGGTDHYLNAWTNSSNQTTGATAWFGNGKGFEFNPNLVNINYSWSPATFLNNPLISNPLATGMTSSQTYTVTASNDDGCSSSASVLVEVGVPLAATATSGGNNFCELLNNTLSASVHGGCQPYTYSWSEGITVVGTSQNVTFAPPAGTTTYVLTVTDACSGTATSSVTITVKPAPPTAVTKSKDVCGNDPSILTASGAVSYLWTPTTFLNVINGPTVISSATSAIVYTVTGTGTNGCQRSATIPVNVYPSVIVNPTATPSILCVNGTSELRANAATDNGYTVSSITPNILSPAGTPALVGFTNENESVTANLPLPFGFNHYGVNYTTWSVSTNGYIGFGSLLNSSNSQVIPNTSTPNNLIALCWGDLNVNSSAGSSVTYFTNGSAPNRVFVVSFNNLKWTSLSLGNVSGQIQLYEGTDVIELHLTQVDHGSTTSLNALGIENATGAKGDSVATRNRGTAWDVTTPEAYRFAPVVPAYTFNWTPATFLSASNVSGPTASNVTSSQSYTVLVTNPATNCSGSGTVTLTAGVPLVVNASALNPTQCAGDANPLSVSAAGGKAPYTYSWSDGTSVISTDQNITVNPVVTTHYTATVTDFCGVQTASASVDVIVNPLPVLAVTPNGGSICDGSPSSISMTASGANMYAWSPSGGLNSVSGATVVAASAGNLATTVYTVTGTNTTTGCVNKTTATVYRNFNTTASATASPAEVCASQSSQLNSLFTVKTNPTLLLTEVTQFASGTIGATSPRPSYFAATDDDFVEISNLSNNALAVGGLTFELWSGASLNRSYSIPAGTNLQGHSVLVLHIGAGTDNAGNNYFHTGGTNNPLVSSIAYGYLLKSGSTILDAVATTANDGNTYAWPAASGVNAAHWTGTIPYTSNNAAGVIRVGGFDLNDASDWTYASDDNRQTLGSYNNTYGSNSQPAFTYSWSPATYLSDATLQNPVVSGSTGGTLNYTVTATDPASGCSNHASTTLTVTPLPTVTISGPSSTCAGTGITLNFAFTGVGPWTYSYTDGSTVFGPYTTSSVSATQSVTPPGAAGTTVTYTAASISDSRCDGTASSLIGSVAVTLSSYSSVNGITLTSNKPFDNICVGDNITLTMNGITAASLGTGAHWKWYTGSCMGGTPVAGSTDMTSITVNPGVTTTYYVRAEGTCNTTPCVSLQVIVTATPPTGTPGVIYTPTIAYTGASDSLVVTPVAGATFYHWTTNGNSNILFDGHAAPYESTSNKVTVTFVNPSTNGNGIGNYHIQFFAGNACGTTRTTNIKIRATVDQPSAVNGTLVACPGQTKSYTVSPVVGAKTYEWSVTGGGTITGNGTQTVNVTFGTLPATVCVHGVSAFGSAGPDLCVNVTTTPAAPGTISGNAVPCKGSTEVYSVATVDGAVSYTWTCSVGGAIVTPNMNSVTIQYPAGAFSGSVCVTASSNCGTSTQTCLPVTAAPTPQLGNITGFTDAVCGATSVQYDVTSIGASNYTWTVPAGATIATGQGTTSILVDFTSSYAGGNITVVSTSPCGNASKSLYVTGAPSVPVFTDGPSSACDETYGYTVESNGATGYIWTVDGGDTIHTANANNILVTWNSLGGSVSVVATNSCGQSAPAVLTVNSNCRMAGSHAMLDALQAIVYPNPSQGQVTLQYNSTEEASYLLKITDLAGRVLQRQSLEASEGLNRHAVDLGQVAKGVYMLSIENTAGEKIVIRMVIE